MKRLALALAVASAFVALPVLATAPAAADTPGCVGRQEYRKIRDGMARGKVHNIFDTNGKSLFENFRSSAQLRAGVSNARSLESRYWQFEGSGAIQQLRRTWWPSTGRAQATLLIH